MDARSIAALYLLTNFGSTEPPTAEEFIAQEKKLQRLEAILEAVFKAGCWAVAFEAIPHGIKQGDPIPQFDVDVKDLIK